jgi:hypothetical protein
MESRLATELRDRTLSHGKTRKDTERGQKGCVLAGADGDRFRTSGCRRAGPGLLAEASVLSILNFLGTTDFLVRRSTL